MSTTPSNPNEARCDVVVIGGGIQGAGCAQAAAAAGYRVRLLEQATWGSGTSSRSSKLIHGGLRYLETGQLRLVRESIVERARLARIAAPLVRPVPFYIPVYRHSRRRPWQILAGLSLYGLIGGFSKLSRFRVVRRRDWHQLDGLDQRGLQRVFQYWDTQTHDRLLTRAVVRSAESLGASACEHARFLHAAPHADGWRVVYCRDRTSSGSIAASSSTPPARGPATCSRASTAHPRRNRWSWYKVRMSNWPDA